MAASTRRAPTREEHRVRHVRERPEHSGKQTLTILSQAILSERKKAQDTEEGGGMHMQCTFIT